MKYSREELQARAQHALRQRDLNTTRWTWLLLQLMLRFPGMSTAMIEAKIEVLSRGETVE